MNSTVSVRKTFANKRVLLTGGSGFLGKVWLAQVLDQIPEVGKIYLLLRKNGNRNVHERFEKILNTSYVFEPLHKKYGKNLSQFISEKIEVLEGDVTLPQLGLSSEILEHLYTQVNLMVNCVGLVDFNPDVREAISTNIEGTLNCVEFIGKCENASFLHVSTCYVAGNRNGRIEEKVIANETPSGKPFNPERELQDLQSAVDALLRESQTSEFEKRIQSRLNQRENGTHSHPNEPKKKERILQLLRRKETRDQMTALGVDRAKSFGWPNTYTYTKALCEMLLAKRGNKIRYSVFRPSIVESSFQYPFPGWNEGFNTSGPLAYLLGGWFKNLPARVGNPFDVIPVDLVANGITIASTALLLHRNAPVYQCGSSDRNLFRIEEACEFTSLGHQIHFREHGKTALERIILSRLRAKPVPINHLFSTKNVKRWVAQCNKLASKLPTTKNLKNKLERLDRKLTQAQDMLDLFLPFIHDNQQIFETKALVHLQIEEVEFRFAPEKIDWKKFWLEIHMPGLRRWCFPSIEGRDREILKPKFPVQFKPPLKQEDLFVQTPQTAPTQPFRGLN